MEQDHTSTFFGRTSLVELGAPTLTLKDIKNVSILLPQLKHRGPGGIPGKRRYFILYHLHICRISFTSGNFRQYDAILQKTLVLSKVFWVSLFV